MSVRDQPPSRSARAGSVAAAPLSSAAVRRVRLIDALRERHPDEPDPEALVRAGAVRVDGMPVTNPASMVTPASAIAIHRPSPPRGVLKLRAALARFRVRAGCEVALDAGAATGGFTTALLEHGLRRVYAVDVGHGQLLGSLRNDERVVVLERTNIADLSPQLIRDPVDLVTLDLSYLSLTTGVPQLERVPFSPGAELVALVKPMFELRLAQPPEDDTSLQEALRVACEGIEVAGWRVLDTMPSPVLGGRGARELLVHAVRDRPDADAGDDAAGTARMT